MYVAAQFGAKKTHLTESDELIYFKPAKPIIIN